MAHANLVQLVRELSITINAAQTFARQTKSREVMELVVSAHSTTGCH